MKTIIIQIIKGYQQTISKLFPSTCRFYPSCSQYMIEAIQVYGLWQGIWKGLKRIGKCHPFHPGGVDEVS